jgi:hypothetical protein
MGTESGQCEAVLGSAVVGVYPWGRFCRDDPKLPHGERGGFSIKSGASATDMHPGVV